MKVYAIINYDYKSYEDYLEDAWALEDYYSETFFQSSGIFESKEAAIKRAYECAEEEADVSGAKATIERHHGPEDTIPHVVIKYEEEVGIVNASVYAVIEAEFHKN